MPNANPDPGARPEEALPDEHAGLALILLVLLVLTVVAALAA
jgi:hypothetical protein